MIGKLWRIVRLILFIPPLIAFAFSFILMLLLDQETAFRTLARFVINLSTREKKVVGQSEEDQPQNRSTWVRP